MPHRLLLADDSLTIQKVVELTFSEADYEIHAVGSGDKAVEALASFRPEIVLADVVMPGLTGYEVCEAVKRLPDGPFIPVVLLTGTFEPFDRARAERVGCDSIVTKPFDSHALASLVRDLIAKSRKAREAAPTIEIPSAAIPEPDPSRATVAFAVPSVVPSETASFPTIDEPEDDAPGDAGDGAGFATMAMRIPPVAELREQNDPPTVPPWMVQEKIAEASAPRAPEAFGWAVVEPAAVTEPEREAEAVPAAAEAEPIAAPAAGVSDRTTPLPRDGAAEAVPVREPEPEWLSEAAIESAPEAAPEPPLAAEPLPLPPPPRFDSSADDGFVGEEPMRRDIDEDIAEFEKHTPNLERETPWGRFEAAEEGAAPASHSEPAELEALAAQTSLSDLKGLIPGPAGVLSDADLDRVARRVVELLGDRVIRDLAWDIVPEMAERLIRIRIKELEEA